MRPRQRISLGVSVVLLVMAVFAVIFRQDISDYVKLRNYTPSPEIVSLADNTTMLPGARRVFYVNHPSIADKTDFNLYCRDHNNEFTIVLGCYVQDHGIYLLDVDDERLNGIKEVTAAHEFLHSAYDRLGRAKREEVNDWLESFYVSLQNDRIRQTIEVYREQDPSIVTNELHSILGTEVRNLSPELEEYYAQYFNDRSQIVSYSEQYEQAFIERRNQIRDYDSQLAELKAQIENLETQLTQTDQELKDQRETMNQLRSSGQVEAYNAQVPSYNAKVNQYNKDIDGLSALIVRHNEIVQKRNSIAAEEAELVEAIDSREAVPQQ